MSELPTHKANLALVQYTHDMAAQINISACSVLALYHANMYKSGATAQHTPAQLLR